METTVYLIRHSEPMNVNNIINNDSLQLQNEKKLLSIDGEELAKKLSESNELERIDKLYSSNYVRAISTAKYIALKNNIDINVVEDFGERKVGISSWNEYPKDFEIRQFKDENYKIGTGESRKETTDRVYNALFNVLDNNKGKRIAIVFHATAIAFLLMKWCDIQYNEVYKFNGKCFFDGNWDYCETFRLVFNGKNDLVMINNYNLVR